MENTEYYSHIWSLKGAIARDYMLLQYVQKAYSHGAIWSK